jgi:hypothetical protein
MLTARSVIAGGLMLLWAAVSAQQTNQAPQTGGPIQNQQPLPVQAPVTPTSPPTPSASGPVPAAVPAPVVVNPVLVVPAPSPTFSNDLRGRIRGDEEHYYEQKAAAKSEFDLRQATEQRDFEATLAGKGFWESRRLRRQFRAAQAKSRLEFDTEQETKRRTYEWRYPP